jgi:hypothetical protein
MTPRDEVSMRQMLDHASEAQRLASGRNRKDLDTDRLFHLAMTRLLEIVGEAAGASLNRLATSIPTSFGHKSSACEIASYTAMIKLTATSCGISCKTTFQN